MTTVGLLLLLFSPVVSCGSLPSSLQRDREHRLAREGHTSTSHQGSPRRRLAD